MLLHPPQPSAAASASSAIAHYDLLPHPALAHPYPPRATPRSLAAVDRLPIQPQHPPPRADQPRHPDSPLEHPHSYHYVPRPQQAHSSSSPDAMYHHQHHPQSVPSHLYDDQQQQNAHPTHPAAPAATHTTHPQQQDFDQPRQQPPAIHTDNLLYPSECGNYSPSPASSPSENPMAAQSRQFSFPQPMSAPHTQNAFPPRFEHDPALPRFPFPNQTLDRRMSEPVLGAGRQAYPQPPPPSHHDTFAYSAASSATMMQPSPLSPRPSSSYSSYGSYPAHERDNSGASLASAGIPDAYPPSAAPTWGSGIKQSDLEQDSALTSSPLSPLYAASAASGSDASVSGLPSPPIQSRPSPSRQAAQLSARQSQPSPTSTNTPRASGNSKTYSFVSLPGNAVKKRPRRRYDEIERLYQCKWPGCTKAYGTLNHLNAHVTMQRHGAKRSPNEFKELRKQWRQQKKEQEEQEREREREAAHQQALAMRDMHLAHHAQMAEYEHQRHVRRRMSMVDPYPDPHAHSLPSHSYMHGGMQGQGPGPAQVQSAFGGHPQSAPAFTSLQGPGMGMDARYGLPSPADEMTQFRYPPPPTHAQVSQGLPSISLAHHAAASTEDDIYFRNPASAGQPIPPTPHGEPVGPTWATPHTPAQQHAHAMRTAQPFYTAQGTSTAITLPPPHALGSLSVSAPNPSPLSGGSFPSLASGAATSSSSLAGAGTEVANGLGLPAEGGSPAPELTAHVSLGSNRLPPDSTLLTPLPGYEPDMDQTEVDDRGREHEYALGRSGRTRDYEPLQRDDRWDRGRERERYYAGATQGNGRDQQYE
ncbi:hypothetical protein C8Q77DRAFT_210013 [Trametes polyzona]|nr:hypothetical protein C8Q77DRAFT_210013 [Trametes polyzona]